MAGTIILFVALAGIGCWILIQLADARDWRAHAERMKRLRDLEKLAAAQPKLGGEGALIEQRPGFARHTAHDGKGPSA